VILNDSKRLERALLFKAAVTITSFQYEIFTGFEAAIATLSSSIITIVFFRKSGSIGGIKKGVRTNPVRTNPFWAIRMPLRSLISIAATKPFAP
jgi:hypothetical protein